jgi:predicted helicase
VKTVYDVLDTIRESSDSTHEMGFRFELATLYFLKNDPFWKQKFSEVWMWADAPVCSGHDTGIDLVARDADTDGYWAIQCKCFAETYYLQKQDIDSFFNEAGKDIYVGRIVVAATENWSKHALKSVHDWGAQRILPRDIAESPLDWEPFLNGRPDAAARRRTYDLRPHQEAAIEDVVAGLHTADRGKLIMACGTGKTLTALRLAERLAPTGKVLFLMPSISLLSQTLREWANQTATDETDATEVTGYSPRAERLPRSRPTSGSTQHCFVAAGARDLSDRSATGRSRRFGRR